MLTTLGELKEYNDFNNVTMAHEDGTQVRQTRSSSHHPVKIDTKVKEKSESQVEQTVEKNGVKRSILHLKWDVKSETIPCLKEKGNFREPVAKFDIDPTIFQSREK